VLYVIIDDARYVMLQIHGAGTVYQTGQRILNLKYVYSKQRNCWLS